MKNLIHRGNFISVFNIDGWEVVERNTNDGNVASVLAVSESNELILVEQYRIPVGKSVIECPAGLIGDHNEKELPIQCAIKELLEETGYISNNWELIYTSPKSPGIINEIVYKYIARECVKIEKGGGVDNEKIIVHTVNMDNLYVWFEEQQKQGKLIDAGIYAGLYNYL